MGIGVRNGMIDYQKVSRELVRALRGDRSQTALSRRLGYRTNAVYTWEAGRSWPTAAQTLVLANRTGVDVDKAVRGYFVEAPAWYENVSVATRAGVAQLLAHERGSTPIVRLAERSGFSRFAVSRWLTGRAEPRLPEFLALLDAATQRSIDFIATLVDPAELPAAAEYWSEIGVRRRIAHEQPWAVGVLRVLELRSYLALPAHRPGWIAQRLSIGVDEEARCIAALERGGLIAWTGSHYLPVRVAAVTTRASPKRSVQIKTHWSQVGMQRMQQGGPGLFGYNVFNVAEQDLERLQQMHLAYMRSIRSVVASTPSRDRVVLATAQLVPLDGG